MFKEFLNAAFGAKTLRRVFLKQLFDEVLEVGRELNWTSVTLRVEIYVTRSNVLFILFLISWVASVVSRHKW